MECWLITHIYVYNLWPFKHGQYQLFFKTLQSLKKKNSSEKLEFQCESFHSFLEILFSLILFWWLPNAHSTADFQLVHSLDENILFLIIFPAWLSLHDRLNLAFLSACILNPPPWRGYCVKYHNVHNIFFLTIISKLINIHLNSFQSHQWRH